ncbi:TlpA disulfide reductase family protein [Aquimarina sp. MMG016]|uniref:TlpA disulfide reductase family protein n=1 Tax=Aquimarina sp. MMG016 TaxID=2822690 RepID=UPI001B3A7848|nr:TlpA disulfide reductase family protein [Aquimarina sp. MMG016]MBQ4821654.1 AhpC/TSA family protein [Aquimarina sp. MMG016]
MKKIFLLITALLLLGCNKQQKDKVEKGFVINGKATNFKEGTLLYLDDPDTQARIDSVTIINGEFQFKGKLNKPKRLFLTTKFDPQNQDTHKYTSFWVDNGVINFEGDYNDFRFPKVSGLKLHDINRELSKLTQPINRRMDSLSKLYNDDNENNRRVSSEVQKAMRINDSITMRFVKENPNNYVSLSSTLYLTDNLSKEELRAIYNALDQDLKETDEGKAIKQYMNIDKILEKGDQLADLQGETLSGEVKSLAAIVKQHKYTILDFWAAGCGPCRMQSKQYTDLHETYQEKGLAIVSFSLDKNKEHWKKASEEDSISWINISDLKGMDGIAPMTYGIRGIPNSFLINQEGQIVSEFNGFNPNEAPFQNELEEFFEKETE